MCIAHLICFWHTMTAMRTKQFDEEDLFASDPPDRFNICSNLSSFIINWHPNNSNNILTIFESDNWSFQIIYRAAFDLRYFKFSVNYGWVETDLHSWVELRCRVEFGANGFVSTFQPPRAQPKPPPCCTPVYFSPTTKSDILHLTDSILHCCTNFTFYRFNSRQSLFPPAAPFPVEIPGDSWGRFKFPPFYIQLRSLKAKGMQGVNLVECCQTLLLNWYFPESGGRSEVCADMDVVFWTGIIWALIIWQNMFTCKKFGIDFFSA